MPTNDTVNFEDGGGFMDDFLGGMGFDESPAPKPTPKTETAEPAPAESESSDIADAIRIKTGYDIEEVKGTIDAVVLKKADSVQRESTRRGGPV